jgi:hypothetical protein
VKRRAEPPGRPAVTVRPGRSQRTDPADPPARFGRVSAATHRRESRTRFPSREGASFWSAGWPVLDTALVRRRMARSALPRRRLARPPRCSPDSAGPDPASLLARPLHGSPPPRCSLTRRTASPRPTSRPDPRPTSRPAPPRLLARPRRAVARPAARLGRPRPQLALLLRTARPGRRAARSGAPHG